MNWLRYLLIINVIKCFQIKLSTFKKNDNQIHGYRFLGQVSLTLKLGLIYVIAAKIHTTLRCLELGHQRLHLCKGCCHLRMTVQHIDHQLHSE